MSLTALLAGCGGKPFNVRPQPTMPPASYKAQAQAGSLTIQAEAVLNEDYLYDNFDANLILAGVLPVRVRLTNTGSEPVELKRARFTVASSAGREFKQIDAKKAFERLMSYYGVSVYSKSGYKESRQDFTTYALDLKPPLPPGESRYGVLFFETPVESSLDASLTLRARRLDTTQPEDAVVELKLN
ncbi:MAG TPA: hypothetical protein VNO70_08215 [Blastocatellia bacterium]|nr:hypothetical protein [Blastocatellia bacterium]